MFTAAGANRVVSVDLHSGQIQGFFDGPVDHLTAMPVLVDYVKAQGDVSEFVIVAPDAGGVKVAERFAHRSARTSPSSTSAVRRAPRTRWSRRT